MDEKTSMQIVMQDEIILLLKEVAALQKERDALQKERDSLRQYILKCETEPGWVASSAGAQIYINQVSEGYNWRRLDCGMTTCPLEKEKANEEEQTV